MKKPYAITVDGKFVTNRNGTLKRFASTYNASAYIRRNFTRLQTYNIHSVERNAK